MNDTIQRLTNRFEHLEYVTQMGPEKFTDYDFADEAQADIDHIMDTLRNISEHAEPVVYQHLMEDLVASLEALEAHLQ